MPILQQYHCDDLDLETVSNITQQTWKLFAEHITDGEGSKITLPVVVSFEYS